MIEQIKRAMRNYWVLSIFCIVLGVALIINPQFFTNAIGYAVGGVILAYGGYKIIRYFVESKNSPADATGLAAGIILAAAGIFIMVRPDFIPKIVAVIFGVYMLVSGIVNIQDAMNIKATGSPTWKRALIPAILTTILGLVILVNPFFITDLALTVLGIGLLISGISNITGCFSAGRMLKQFRQDNGSGGNKDDFIDI